MTKIIPAIQISSCGDCPNMKYTHLFLYQPDYPMCTHAMVPTIQVDLDKPIPEWCPLEDANES